MKLLKLISINLFLALILGGCAPQMTAVWQKENYRPQPTQKMAVIVISKNLEGRQKLEKEIVNQLKDQLTNTKFVKGLELFPPNTTKDDWTIEKVEALLKKHDIDMVLTSSMVHSYVTEDYQSSGQLYYPRYYRVGPYIYNTYNMIYQPGYYVPSQNFVIESNIFDLRNGFDKKEALIWKGQSEVRNPSSISSGAYAYAKNLVEYLESTNYLAQGQK